MWTGSEQRKLHWMTHWTRRLFPGKRLIREREWFMETWQWRVRGEWSWLDFFGVCKKKTKDYQQFREAVFLYFRYILARSGAHARLQSCPVYSNTRTRMELTLWVKNKWQFNLENWPILLSNTQKGTLYFFFFKAYYCVKHFIFIKYKWYLYWLIS